MAKVSSARGSSRQSQTAPQEASATGGRATRQSARSQSREPSEPVPQRAKKAAARTQKNGRGKVKGKAAEDLAPVEEDDNEIQQQLQAETLADQQIAAGQNDEDNRRVSAAAYSTISGTTAKTSFSQEEISDLDADNMIYQFPKLAATADELAKHIVPLDSNQRAAMRKEIRTAGTKHNKLFNSIMNDFRNQKQTFSSTAYVQPSVVLRALLKVQNIEDVPEGPWRPDSIIYKINLAQMLESMLITLHGNGSNDITSGGYNAIEHLDGNFATAIAGPIFRQDALQLGVSILTQLTIIRLSFYMANLDFVPSKAILEIFYKTDSTGNDFIKDEEGNWIFRYAKDLHLHTLPADDQALALGTSVHERANQLVSAFDDANAETWMPALGQLRAQFPWDEFVDQVIQYYFDRRQQLDTEIAASNGISEIMANLTAEVERRSDTRAAEEKRQSFARPGGTPKKGFGKAGIRALKARERQMAVAAAAPPAPALVAQMRAHPSGGVVVDDGWQRPADDDNQVIAPTTAQSIARSTWDAMTGLQQLQRERAERNQGRSLLDRQAGAQRVSFDDSQLTQYEAPDYASSAPQRGPYFASPRRGGNPGKRPYQAIDEEPEDFDPTQDGGFEVDSRDTAPADERRRQIASQAAPPPVRFSSAGPAAGPASSMPPPGSTGTPSPSKRQRKNPGSSIPPPPPQLDPDEYVDIPREDRFAHAKIAARHGTVTANQRKPAQVRQPWTGDEDNALINLIEEEGGDGISYSKLKALDDQRPDGPRLARRTAEDMRFKARNMKETFLKGRVVLPTNFKYIVLDKKAMNKLHSMGIEYHQDRIRGGANAFEINE